MNKLNKLECFVSIIFSRIQYLRVYHGYIFRKCRNWLKFSKKANELNTLSAFVLFNNFQPKTIFTGIFYWLKVFKESKQA
jgi:hypothetical protein